MKKILFMASLMIAIFIGVGTTTTYASATKVENLHGVYETDSGVRFIVSDPSNKSYTGIKPDEPSSGYDCFYKQNADVGVQVTYNEETDETTYLYDYIMFVPYPRKGCEYWSFDLGNNKISITDEYKYYVVNRFNFNEEYLVDDIDNKNPSYFNFYASEDFPAGSYQLKIVVKGNKTVSMNGVDVIEELSGVNAIFEENDVEGESPCKVPTSNAVYDYFYYSYSNNLSKATTAEERLAEFVANTAVHIYDDIKPTNIDRYHYLMDDILGGKGSDADYFNHEGHLYKHAENCSFFLYTEQNANYPAVYVNGIFDQGLLSKYFYDSSVKKESIDSGKNTCSNNQYKYDYATYLKNGHTSAIEYYTLSLKYSYKVYTPKNLSELSFNGYMDEVANKMSDKIDRAYQKGINSRQGLIDSLNQQITDLNQQIIAAESEKTNLNNQIEQKNQQIANLQASIASEQAELDAKKKELASAQNEVDVLSAAIQEKEAQLAALEEDVNANQEEIANLKGSIVTLNNLWRNSKAQVTSLEKQVSERDARIVVYQHNVASLEAEIASAQEEITNLNKSVQSYKSEITDKEYEIDTLNRVISFKDDKIAGLEQDIEDNRFFNKNGYWSKLFNFKDVEHWSFYNWITWIGLGLLIMVVVIIILKKRK